MNPNPYRKGSDGERELARILSDLFGIECRRGASPYLPGIVAPDIYGLPGLHIEAKRRERVSLPAALRQAKADAGDKLAIVAHRGNRQPWLATLELVDLPVLADHVNVLRTQSRTLAPPRRQRYLETRSFCRPLQAQS